MARETRKVVRYEEHYRDEQGNKKTNEFWMDSRGNKWNISRYSAEIASELAATLDGCEDCVDCENCVSCTRCWRCTNCKECFYCDNCMNCIDCYKGRDYINQICKYMIMF